MLLLNKQERKKITRKGVKKMKKICALTLGIFLLLGTTMAVATAPAPTQTNNEQILSRIMETYYDAYGNAYYSTNVTEIKVTSTENGVTTKKVTKNEVTSKFVAGSLKVDNIKTTITAYDQDNNEISKTTYTDTYNYTSGKLSSVSTSDGTLETKVYSPDKLSGSVTVTKSGTGTFDGEATITGVVDANGNILCTIKKSDGTVIGTVSFAAGTKGAITGDIIKDGAKVGTFSGSIAPVVMKKSTADTITRTFTIRDGQALLTKSETSGKTWDCLDVTGNVKTPTESGTFKNTTTINANTDYEYKGGQWVAKQETETSENTSTDGSSENTGSVTTYTRNSAGAISNISGSSLSTNDTRIEVQSDTGISRELQKTVSSLTYTYVAKSGRGFVLEKFTLTSEKVYKGTSTLTGTTWSEPTWTLKSEITI